MSFKHYQQRDAMDCGPTCLRMVAKHHGRLYPLPLLRDWCFIDREGVSLAGISEAAERVGLRTMAVRIDFEMLAENAPLPCIVHWNQNHFIVVYRCTTTQVWVADPGAGKFKLSKSEFLQGWTPKQSAPQIAFESLSADSIQEIEGGFIQSNNNSSAQANRVVFERKPPEIAIQQKGIALLIEPTPDFYTEDDDDGNFKSAWNTEDTNFSFLLAYLRPYKRLVVQLGLGLLAGSGLQLLFPLLTQAVIDVGIEQHNLSFVYIVLAGQVMLFLSQAAVEFIRAWILLHISTRINIALISDFLLKLLQLPIGFFETKTTGDLMQRIGDHHRIEQFLTGQSLNTLFSLFNLVVFGAVILGYNPLIFCIVMGVNGLYGAWIYLFLKRRKELDYKRFNLSARNQGQLMELIGGVQEIKLANAERSKRWEWERTQARLFATSVQGLGLEQWQQAGGMLLQQAKDVLITFIAAKAVIDGSLTLGMMLALQYIVAQLNSPLQQLIGFVRGAQDAKISLERLSEIHINASENSNTTTAHNDFSLPQTAAENLTGANNADKSDAESNALRTANLSFRYGSSASPLVLNDLSLLIPRGKTTAIVGSSGSGKTTLLKLLLKFYPPSSGNIAVGSSDFAQLDNAAWRAKCGVVMQDGYIFSDTIARNIALGDENIDYALLNHAAEVANIREFVKELPQGWQTKIGSDGLGLSGGQKQRLLIARAVYKHPDYVFFDEATSSLDAHNERVIMENLAAFCAGRTVVVVAHRLSTVKNADQIVVLEKGKIAELGTHTELTAKRGAYYNLVKNQLELGN